MLFKYFNIPLTNGGKQQIFCYSIFEGKPDKIYKYYTNIIFKQNFNFLHFLYSSKISVLRVLKCTHVFK